MNAGVMQGVQFREQNLLQIYSGLGRFDVIFCRDVLICFSAQRKVDILTRIAQSLNSGGYLFLGASETISGYSMPFIYSDHRKVRYPISALVHTSPANYQFAAAPVELIAITVAAARLSV